MTECTHCRKRYDDGVRFCPVDGYAVAQVAEPWVGRLLMGQFQIQSVCGHGATGTVYRAVQAGMERAVAVKVLRADLLKDSDVIRRFVREARAGAKLNHQNIATVHMVGQTDDGVPFLVMEYVEGLALASILAVGKPLPLARIVHIGAQIASALSEAHSQGIVHRDLKPENILLTERRGETDVVKVVDFGIAKMVAHAAPGEDPISRMGTVFGTPHYIAPEQASGQSVDGRADIYSLGCILYQMATGHVPFEGQAGLQVLLSQVRDEVPDPRRLNPRLSEPLAELILQALAKDPSERPQTAEAFGQRLQKLVLPGAIPAASGRAPEPRPVSARAPQPAPAASDEQDSHDRDRDRDRDHAAFFGDDPDAPIPRSGRDVSRRPPASGSARGRASGRRGSEGERGLRAGRRHERSRREESREQSREQSSDTPQPFVRRHWLPLVGVGGAVTVGLLVGLLYSQWTGRAPTPTPPPPALAAVPPPAAPARPTTAGRAAVPLVKPAAATTVAKKSGPEPVTPPPELVLPAVPALTGPRIVQPPTLPPTASLPAPASSPLQPAAPAVAPVAPPAPAAAPPAAAPPTPAPQPAAPPPAVTPSPAATPPSPAAEKPAPAEKPAAVPPAEKPAPPPAEKPAPPAEKPAPPAEKPASPPSDEPEEPSSDPYHRLK